MLKNTLAASLAVISMVTVAQAADFDSKYNSRSRASESEVVSKKFNGCYGGANAGYQIGTTDLAGIAEVGSDGAIYGIQVGCDYSLSSHIFLGGYAGYGDTNVSSDQLFGIVTGELGQYWELGGRLGYKLTPASAIYAKAGYRDYDLDVKFMGSTIYSDNIPGYVLGAGYEQYLTQNISYFIEGEYFTATDEPVSNIDTDALAIKGGLNIRLDLQ